MPKPEDYSGILNEDLTNRTISALIPALAITGAIALGDNTTYAEPEVPAIDKIIAVMPEEVAIALPGLNKLAK